MGKAEREKACKFLTIRIGNVYGAMGLVGNIANEGGINFCANRMEKSWKKKTGWDDGWDDSGNVYHSALDTITPAINNGTYRNYRIDGDGTRRLASFKNDNCRDAFANDYVGWGIVQWTFNSRKYALYDFAIKWCNERHIPFNIGNLEMQLDFILKELNGAYKTTYAVLMITNDILTASNYVCINYERPQGYNMPEVQRNRYITGKQIFNEVFGGKPTQWFKYNEKWYYYENGRVKYDKWIEYNGEWYHLGIDGAMEVNKWILYDNKWYYLNNDGISVKDSDIEWQGMIYHLGSDGAMIEQKVFI